MMTKTSGQAHPSCGTAPAKTLADALISVERNNDLSHSRRRDLRSAVMRVAALIGDIPSRIALDLPAISTRLAGVSPMAVGMTAKRYSNIRSDFLAAIKASNLASIVSWRKSPLAPAWRQLFASLAPKRAHLGLSRFARYASVRGIDPRAVTDEIIADFVAAVREQSLHGAPNWLHRQVTKIWNEVARDPKLGLKSVAIPSFRGPPKRIEWSLLPRSFQQDVDKFLDWAGRSDPFAVDSRRRRLGPQTSRLRRNQIHAAVSALVVSGIRLTAVRDLADLVTPANLKRILKRRVEIGGRRQKTHSTIASA